MPGQVPLAWQTFRTALSCRMHRIERARETDPKAALPSIVLEITRGRAKHRRREVLAAAFLIGAADDCDLVLGDPRFPEVHSYLFVRTQGVTIRQLGLGPALVVGGRTVTCAALDDLDTLEMGPYEFRVLIQWPQAGAGDGNGVGRRAEELVCPIRHQRAIERLLDDVEQYSPAPRLSLFVGDAQQESADAMPRHTSAEGAIWRQSQRTAIS